MPLKYTQELNLLDYNVYHECDPYKPTFFVVDGIMNKTIGYGKHTFTIGIMNPVNIMDSKLSNLSFKQGSNILFEVIDNYGSVVKSSLTEYQHINGTSYGYIHIEEDLLRSYDEIANGPARLIIVGQLDGPNLPEKWKNSYNIRTQIPFYISKNQPNESQVLFKETPTVRVSQSYQSFGDKSTDILQKSSTIPYNIHEFDNLHAYGGQVNSIEISYQLSSSLNISEQFKELDTFQLTSSLELLTNDISKSEGDLHVGVFTIADQVTKYWTTGSAPMSVGNTTSFGRGDNMLINGLNLSGQHAAVSPVIRRTLDDEQFSIQLLMSGSGAWAVLHSPYKDELRGLSDNVNPAIYFFEDDYKVLTKNNSIEVALHKKFGGSNSVYPNDGKYHFNPNPIFNNQDRKGPVIDGDVKPDLFIQDKQLNGDVGNYDKYTFTIPSGSYFVVRVSSDKGRSASFADISVKHKPPKGVNPTHYYYKAPIPDIDFNYDLTTFRYRFLDGAGTPVKKYTQYPVVDQVVSKSLQSVLPFTKTISRKWPVTGVRIRNFSESITGKSTGLHVEAAASGSTSITGSLLGQIGVHGIMTEAVVSDDVDNIGGVSSLTVNTNVTPTHPDNTGSAWAARFLGDAGAGDVLFTQNVGIGDFTWPTEHPSASLHVKGDIIAENYIVKSTVTEMTTSFSSGSTIFGDSYDDTHEFTGSLFFGSGSQGIATQIDEYGAITASGDIMIKNLSQATQSIKVRETVGPLGIPMTSLNIEAGSGTGANSYTGGQLRLLTGKGKQIDLYGHALIGVATDDNKSLIPPSMLTVLGDISSSQNLGIQGSASFDGNISGSGTIVGSKWDGDLTVAGDFSASGDLYVAEGKYLIGKSSPTVTNGKIGWANDSFYIFSGSNGRVVMNGTGFGIGTSTPPEKLTVDGNISGSGDLHLEGTASIGDGDLMFIHADASNSHIVARNNNFLLRTNRTQDRLKFQPNNTDVMIVSASGDVGIGTTTPSNTLEVAGNISASGAIHTLSHITASGNISSSGTLIGNSYLVGDGLRIRDHQGGVNFPDGAGLSSTNITASGHISMSNTSNLYLGGNIIFDAASAVYFPSTIGDTDTGMLGLAGDLYLKSSDDIIFQPGESTAMVFFGEGRTRIGSSNLTAPTSVLEVAGDISSSGNLIVDGDVSSSLASTGSFGRIECIVTGSFSRIDCDTIDASTGIFFNQSTYIAPSGDDLYIGSDDDLILQPDDDLVIQAGTTTKHTFFAEGKVRINSTATTPANSNLDVTGDLKVSTHITASGDISGSLTSTGSFGRVEAAGNIDVSGVTTLNDLTITGLANQGAENTAVMINGSNVVGTRELGSDAFLSTALHSQDAPTDTYFVISDDGRTMQDSVMNQESNNIGIGNATPQEKLTVAGAISSSGNITTEGTLTAEQITSTDDMSVTDDLTVGGDISLTGTHIMSGTLRLAHNQFMYYDETNNFGWRVYEQASPSAGHRVMMNKIGGVGGLMIMSGSAGKAYVGINTGVNLSPPVEGLTVNGNLSSSGDYYGSISASVNVPTVKYGTGTNILSSTADFSGEVIYDGNDSTTAGQIYYSNNGTWTHTDADAAATATGLIAVALGTNSTTHGMLLRGMVKLDHDPGGNIGVPLYLSTTAGDATSTAPSGDEDIVRIIGYNIGTSGEIYFNPDNTWVEVNA